jgi:DNA-binding transcriptional MerR regulator
MTNGDSLTLAELARTVGMTARNVRAYQTRGLLQPPLRAGRSSVYGAEHVRRLQQVQRARARGASLALLQTLIAEGRDLDGVWSPDRPVPPDHVVDVSAAALAHTADCLARREVPLASVLSGLVADADTELRAAVQALVDAGVFAAGDGDVRVPGSFACAVAALHDQGSPATAAAFRLASALTEAARSVVELVAATARTLDISVGGTVGGSVGGSVGGTVGGTADNEGRRAAATRLGELAAAVVGQLAGRAVLTSDALTGDDTR